MLIACTLYHRPVKLLLSQGSLCSFSNVTNHMWSLEICIFKTTWGSLQNNIIDFAFSLLSPGILGGFLVFARAVHLVPGLLHGRALWSAQDPAVHRPGECDPQARLPWTWGQSSSLWDCCQTLTWWKTVHLRSQDFYVSVGWDRGCLKCKEGEDLVPYT